MEKFLLIGMIVFVLIVLAICLFVNSKINKETDIKIQKTENKIQESKNKIQEIKNKIQENEKKLADKTNEQEEFFNHIINKIKYFTYDYSTETNSGKLSHLFHYKNLYSLVIWQTDNGFEVSIHDMKIKNHILAGSVSLTKESNEKLLTEAFKCLGKFVAKVRLDGHNKDYSYQQGLLEGYKSGYVAGYLKGHEQYLKNEFGISDEKDMIEDLGKVKDKFAN